MSKLILFGWLLMLTSCHLFVGETAVPDADLDTLNLEESKYAELLQSIQQRSYEKGESDFWTNHTEIAAAQTFRDSAQLLAQQARMLLRRSDSLAKDYMLKAIYTNFQRASGYDWESNVRKSRRQLPKLLASGFNNIIPGNVTMPLIEHLAKRAGKENDVEAILDEMMGDIDNGLAKYTVKERISALAQLGGLRVERGKMKEAGVYYSKALKESRANGLANAELHFMLGLIHYNTREWVLADMFVDSAIIIGRNTSNWKLTAEAFRLQSKINGVTSALLDSVMHYHHKADQLRMDARIGGIMAQQALEEKNGRIRRMAERDAAREQIVEQRRLLLIFLSLLVVALFTILWMLTRKIRLGKFLLNKREGELLQQLLRSQMEGHFMYNSLANLQGLIRSGENDSALTYLSMFSKLLQLNQFNSKEPYVSLKAEVAALQAYLNLQQVHWNNIFQYTIDTYAGFEEDGVLIPPMLIQPFVENAVVHGVSHLESGGMVHITITKRLHTIRCCIEDNGPGINEAVKSELKPSVSTEITNERLQVLGKRTGVKGSLTVYSPVTPEKGGTVVYLEIPFREVPVAVTRKLTGHDYATTGRD